MAKLSKTELEVRKKFDWSTIKDRNAIKFDERSGLEHKRAVKDRCWELIEQDEPFYSRARLKYKPYHKEQLVADILIPNWGVVVEIIDSESEESIERKREIWKKEGFSLEIKKVDKKEVKTK